MRDAPVEIELLSPVPLKQLQNHDGATWLDRELVSLAALPRDQGFGRAVRSALAAGGSWLVEQGLATMLGEEASFSSNMLVQLQRRELLRVAAGISRDTGLEFQSPQEGHIEGVLRRRLDLASGRFGLIDNGREFALVPWRPVLERAIGRFVVGRMRKDGGLSWTFGKERGLEV